MSFSTPHLDFQRELPYDAVRKEIDSQIQQLEGSLRLLRFRRNTLAPIHKLPNEILAMIFVASVDSLRSPEQKYNKAFPELTAVCSHWREITICCPKVWSNFKVRSQEWTMVQLDRSGSVPLSVCCESSAHHESFIHSFSNHYYRIYQCELIVDVPEALSTLLPLLESSFPVLKSLQLSVESDDDGFTNFDIQMPHLRWLRLDNITPLWSSADFTRLTHLSIIEEYPEHELREMLTMLRCTPALNVLKMTNCTPYCSEQIPDCDGLVDLDHLSHLQVCGSNLRTCAHFTTHISFPPKCFICITAEGSIREALEELPNTTRMLLSSTPLDDKSHLVVDFTDGVEVTLQTKETSSPRLQIMCPEIVDDDALQPPSFSFIGDSFGIFQGIECLEITLHDYDLMRHQHFRECFREMSHISELRIRNAGHESLISLFEVLQEEWNLILPKLRSLDVEAMEAMSGAYRGLGLPVVFALRMRKSMGIGIQYLRAVRWHKYIRQRHVDYIRGLVDSVEYIDPSL